MLKNVCLNGLSKCEEKKLPLSRPLVHIKIQELADIKEKKGKKNVNIVVQTI